MRKICQIHGVTKSTLHDLVKQGRTISESGRKVGKYLTKDEEYRLSENNKEPCLCWARGDLGQHDGAREAGAQHGWQGRGHS